MVDRVVVMVVDAEEVVFVDEVLGETDCDLNECNGGTLLFWRSFFALRAAWQASAME